MSRRHSYRGDDAAGLDAAVEADGALVLGVLPRGQEVLLAREVGPVVDHEGPALHLAGAAAAQVGGDLGAVADALVRLALEVCLLEEDDLEGKTQIGVRGSNIGTTPGVKGSSVKIISHGIMCCSMLVNI